MSNKSENKTPLPFDPSKIRLVSKVQSIYSLMSRVKHDEIETPTYQRSEIWSLQAKSRLIESILVRIPIPVFYIDASNEDKWKIIDGLQRITALKEFMVEKTLILDELEYVPDLNKSSFDKLPRTFQRRLEETDITIIFINAGTPENVKYNIFKRINTGGLPLSPQEIRHALNDGPATPLLKKISKQSNFTDSWGKENDRMENNELVLRGLGYWFLPLPLIHEKTLDDYLVEAMKAINRTNKKNRIIRVKKFLFAYQACIEIFQDQAFRKISKQRRNTPNKNIYETWMAILSQAEKHQIEKLIDKKEDVYNLFKELIEDKRYFYFIASRKPHTMASRHTELQKQLEAIYND
ncbi:MAG: DUF262 domain-containing protein [Candidatus Electrothrix sp. AR4]|nr:DUF262 domain-containing protein [Candidatus Electrothrix sp. AR4]